MSNESKALELADKWGNCQWPRNECLVTGNAMSDELRRQHAEVESLRTENQRLRGIVPEVLETLNDELCAESESLRAQLAARVQPVPSKMLSELRKMADPKNAWEYGDGTPMSDDATAVLHALSAEPSQQAQQLRCEPCNKTGLAHCAHPDECGGPWSKPPQQAPKMVTPYITQEHFDRAFPDAQQAQGEPVAHCALTKSKEIAFFDGKPMVMVGPVGNEHHPYPLYTTTQQAIEPMTDREVLAGFNEHGNNYSFAEFTEGVRFAERHHSSKGK